MSKTKSFPKKVSVKISNLHPKIRIAQTKVGKLTRKALTLLKQKKELHLTLMNDLGMRKINKSFHATDAATDVLAFEEPRGWSQMTKKPFLGEIIISIDHAKANAKRFRVSPDEELMRYVIHGLLHILGERDHSAKLQKQMFQKQERLLKKISPIPKLILSS